MDDIAELKLKVENVDRVTASLDRLTEAVNGLNDALERLGDKDHGGIVFTMVGGIAEAEIKPAKR